MTIVGFNFTKMEVEKASPASGKVNISNNVAVKDIAETDLSVGSERQKAIKFMFEFTSKYEPKVGKILLGGEVLFLEDSEKVKKILTDWKKDKKIEKELMSNILNTVLAKCNVKALILSQDVSLPSPIPLPKVKMEAGEKKK
ncbi:hypothetical protein GF323_02230 [Candidatus Woesearchaeota archaeon]|nr:hypothetical protein [Candidatus Woesearchaeota archaeon]